MKRKKRGQKKKAKIIVVKSPSFPAATEKGKIRIKFGQVLKLAFFMNVSGFSEVGGLGKAVWDEKEGFYNIEDIRRLDDNASAGQSESSGLSNALFLSKVCEKGDDPADWIVNWHTHPSSMDSFPSPSAQDNMNVRNVLKAGDRVIDLIVAKIGYAFCRLVEKIDTNLPPEDSNLRVTKMSIVWAMTEEFLEAFNEIRRLNEKSEKLYAASGYVSGVGVTSGYSGRSRAHWINGGDGVDPNGVSARLVTRFWGVVGNDVPISSIRNILASIRPGDRAHIVECAAAAIEAAPSIGWRSVLDAFEGLPSDQERENLLRIIVTWAAARGGDLGSRSARGSKSTSQLLLPAASGA